MGKGRASSEIQLSLLLCEASFRGSTSQVWDIQKSFYSENFKYCVIQEDKIFSSKSYYKTASQRIQGTWLQPWHNTLLGQKYSLVSTFPNCLVMHCFSLFVRYFVWNQVHKVTIIFGLFQIKLHSENLRPWLI